MGYIQEMKKFAIEKQRWIRSLIVAVCVFGGAVPVWGGHSNHYASVSVTASGQGKVYMTTDKDYAPGNDDWKDSMSEDWNCKDGVDDENDERTY